MFKKLLLVFGSMAVTVVVVELLLHGAYFVGWLPDYPAIMTRLEKLQYSDPVSQVRFQDNVPRNGRGFRTYTQRDVPRQLIEFSEDGMRLDAYGGTARCSVGVFGDSFAEALQVGQNENLSALAELDLREAGYDVDFRNFARGGDGTTVQYLRYKQLIDQGYEFDDVLLFFYPGNDVSNNVRELNHGESGRYPYFVIEAGELKRDDATGAGLKTSHMWQLREYLAKYSHLANLVMNAKNELFVLPSLLISANGAFDANPNQEWQDAWQVTEKVLEAWADDASSRGSRFVLVMLTTTSQLTDKYSEMEGFDAAYPNRRLQRFTDERGIEFIDILPIAKQYVRDHDLQYPYLSWMHDGHYSQVGHRLVSDTLVAHFHRDRPDCRDERESKVSRAWKAGRGGRS
jgi:hypothetical protein